MSRSLKFKHNPKLNNYFSNVLKWCDENNILVEGELFTEEGKFLAISSLCRTIINPPEIPSHIKWHIFDCLKLGDVKEFNVVEEDYEYKNVVLEADYDMPFYKRLELLPKDIGDNVVLVTNYLVEKGNNSELKRYYDEFVDGGAEGAIVKSCNDKYRLGRTTAKESIGYKMKEFIHEDFKIIDVVQSTVVREGVEKSTDAFGYSKTSKKKDDRVLIEKASAFVCVMKDGREFSPSLSESDNVKKQIWDEREKYIGEFAEVKYLGIGTKNGLPRHPSVVRMRWRDQDE